MSINYNKDTDTGAAWLTVQVQGQDTQVTYESFVCALCKELGSLQANLTHMGLGVGGESGELLDAIKKFTIYGKPIDRANVVEEMGDIEWYLAGIRQMLGITYKEVFEGNVAKLAARYSSGSYSDAQAISRDDKTIGADISGSTDILAADGTVLPSSYLHVIDVTAADYMADPTNVEAELLNEKFPTSTDGSASSAAPTPAPSQEQPATEQPQ